jgi:hypothetical protein
MAEMFNSQVPLEMQPEAQAISRQQKMAELLMQRGMQATPGQTVAGGVYVPTNPLENIANLFNIYAGSKGLENVEQQQLALAKAIREGRSSAEAKIIEAMSPTAEKVTELAGPAYKGQAPIAYQPAAEPNWAEAARLIRTNDYGAGKELLPQVLKNFAPEAPSSVLEYKFAEKNPGYMGYRTELNKAGAPNMTAITNVANFEPFKNKAQGEMGQGLVKQWESLKNIPTEIKNLDKAAELAPKSFAGTFAQQKTDIAKLFNNNLGTKIAVDKINNTEELGSRLFQSTMENLKKMDASPSQYQQKVMQDAFGTITTDPTSLPKIIAVQKEILEQKAISHNTQVKQAETGPAKMEFPYSIYVPIGQETPAAGGWRVK